MGSWLVSCHWGQELRLDCRAAALDSTTTVVPGDRGTRLWGGEGNRDI